MHVETFKNDVVFFTDDVIMCLTSHWLIILQEHDQFIDTDNITPSDQRIIVQITDTYQLSRQNFEQGVGIRVIVNR